MQRLWGIKIPGVFKELQDFQRGRTLGNLGEVIGGQAEGYTRTRVLNTFSGCL